MSKTKPQPLLLGYADAAAESGLPEWMLRKAVWDGRLPSYKPQGPRGRTFIARDDLMAFIEDCRN